MSVSILFDTPEKAARPLAQQPPAFFVDLALDRICEAAAAGCALVDLRPFFYTPLSDPACVRYRQQVLQDLDEPELCFRLRRATNALLVLEQRRAETEADLADSMSGRNDFMTRCRCVHLAGRYAAALKELLSDFEALNPRSPGLCAFWQQLSALCVSPEFLSMQAEASRLEEGLLSISCTMLIRDGTFRLRPFEGEADINREVQRLFSRFGEKDGPARSFRQPTDATEHMIDAQLLGMVSRWNKPLFADIDSFCKKHLHFFEEGVLRFCKEAQFYLCWQALIAPLKERGLAFCYPALDEAPGHAGCEKLFDLALGLRLWREEKLPVASSFSLDDPERVLVITGPNQGGKTTFTRAIGQLYYLTALGCSVPGRSARLHLAGGIYTHFNREEDLSTLSSRLQEELVRLHHILSKAGPQSLVLINEIFASTTLEDGLWLGRKMMEALGRIGCTAVCVTFLDELSSFDEHTVSMTSAVDPADPARRTFEICRRPADGMAYAGSLAQKYHLTEEELNRRLCR